MGKTRDFEEYKQLAIELRECLEKDRNENLENDKPENWKRTEQGYLKVPHWRCQPYIRESSLGYRLDDEEFVAQLPKSENENVTLKRHLEEKIESDKKKICKSPIH